MTDIVGRAIIKITGDVDSRSIEQSGSRIGNGFRKSVLPAIGVLAGLGAEAIDATRAAEDLASKQAKVAKVLSNMGQGDAAPRIIALAGSLETMTTVDDKVILGAQAILGTFSEVSKTAGKVGGAFDRASAAAVDIAATGFTSVDGAAKALGKALQNPAKGLAGLSRIGVKFTDQQTKVIEGFLKAGDTAKAQDYILSNLEKRYKGTAEAGAKSSEKIRTAFENVQESIGTLLLPAFQKFSAALVVMANWATAHPTLFAALAAGIAAVAVALIAVNVAMALLAANPIALAIGAIVLATAGLVIGLVTLYKKSETFRKGLQDLGNEIKEVWEQYFAPSIKKMQDAWARIKPDIDKIWKVIDGPLTKSLLALGDVAILKPLKALGYTFSAIADALDRITAHKGDKGWLQSIKDYLTNPGGSSPSGSTANSSPGTNAMGTNNWRGGLSWVGERGPELVDLPRGARVHTAQDSRRMVAAASGGDTTIVNNYYGPTIGSQRKRETEWSMRYGARFGLQTGAAV